MIDIQPDELAEVERIATRYFKDAQVWAFGSRCKGKARATSDLDLLIKGPKKIDALRLEEAREAFQESTLSFRVDLVDWHALEPSLRDMIEKDLHPIRTGT